MAVRHHEFGATHLKPEGIGKPGHRTFRVLLDSPAGKASLWLEKQQLSELALAVQRLLALNDSAESKNKPPTANPGHLQVEFKVGRIGLDFDAARQALVLLFQNSEATEDESVNISCWLTRSAAVEFSESALAVCAAGRPLCPLCHGPIDPEGHRCPKANGHGVASLEEGSEPT